MNISTNELLELLESITPDMADNFLKDYDKVFALNTSTYKKIVSLITEDKKALRFLKSLKLRKLIRHHIKLFRQIEQLSPKAQQELINNFYSFFKNYEDYFKKDIEFYITRIGQLKERGIDRIILRKELAKRNLTTFVYKVHNQNTNYLKLYSDGVIKQAKSKGKQVGIQFREACLLDLENPTYIIYKFPIEKDLISNVLHTNDININPSILPNKEELENQHFEFSDDITLKNNKNYSSYKKHCYKVKGKKVLSLYKK